MRIEIQGVTKRYGSVVALDEVDLTIDDSEFFFLLGPSGCGKTTLLRLLAGFDAPDEGRILFDGRDIAGTPPEKRLAGMVFQNYALWPHMTVERNVAFGLEARNTPVRERTVRVLEMLNLVHMDGYELRRPGQLSGGQQQRVALARALAASPELVLLDEPLSNLDARLRTEMRMELRAIIQQTQRTAVYVTHDQKEALSMADRCAILRQGRVEQVGPPREVYLTPNSDFVARFLGDADFLSGVTEGLPADGFHRVRIDGLDQVWSARCAAAVPAGARVHCCIRPEAWKLNPPHGSHTLRVTGTIEDSIYLGEVTQHKVRLNGLVNAYVQVLELNGAPAPSVHVELGLDPRDVVLLGA